MLWLNGCENLAGPSRNGPKFYIGRGFDVQAIKKKTHMNLLSMKSVISELNSHLYKRVWMNLVGFYKSFTILLCGVSYNIHSGSLKIIDVPLVSNFKLTNHNHGIYPQQMKHNLFAKNLTTGTSSSSSRNIYIF